MQDSINTMDDGSPQKQYEADVNKLYIKNK